MLEITIITFNYGTAGKYANGPGMCLHNFVSILKKSGHRVNVFSLLDSPYIEATSINQISKVKEAIDRSSVVHHWSGLNNIFGALCSYAKKSGKIVLVGPNVLDGVEKEREDDYLSKTKFDYVLTANERLRYRVSKGTGIDIRRVYAFQVGPDLKLWAPSEQKEDFILWKGNSKQYVKDVNFGLELAKKLKGKYKFKFIGHPKPYNYLGHIMEAKRAKLLICTSLSETMGLSVLEAWASSVPSITHPKIHLHGVNYKTGIITNKTIESYSEAIEEVMEDDVLYEALSRGAHEYVHEKFSAKETILRYFNIIQRVV